MTTDTAPEPSEIELLLPWHAAGRLARREAERVSAALSSQADLARQYAMVREELAETILLNESLGAPSVRIADRLFAKIDQEGGAAQRAPTSAGIGAFISSRLARLTPRTLAWSASAAMLTIVLQAGLLAGLIIGDRANSFSNYPLQSVPQTGGANALIAFAPQATAADITRFLERGQVTLVDGPRGGGMYMVRVSAGSRDELVAALKRMADNPRVIRFAAPTE